MARQPVFLVLGSEILALRLGALQLLVAHQLVLVKTHVGQHGHGRAGEHTTGVVVQERLDARGSRGMPFEQTAHVVDVAVEDDPFLAGTLLDVGKRVDGPLPTEHDGDEAEDAHEERAGKEYDEADGDLLAPGLLGLDIIFADALVGNGKGDAAAEVVPPHGALVVVHLLFEHGLPFFGHLPAAMRGAAAAPALVAAAHVGSLVLRPVGHDLRVDVRMAAVGADRGPVFAAAVARVAGVVAALLGDAALVFALIVAVVTARRPRLLALLRVVGRFVLAAAVVAVGRLFGGLPALATGGHAGRSLSLHAHRGRHRPAVVVVAVVVIVDSRSVVAAVRIVGAELVTHPVGLVARGVAAATATTGGRSGGRGRGRTAPDRPRSFVRIARAVARPRVDIWIHAAAAAAAIRVTAATAAAAHPVVLITAIAIAAAAVELAVMRRMSRELIDDAHQSFRVGGARGTIVAVHAMIVSTSGGALRQSGGDALGGVPVDGMRLAAVALAVTRVLRGRARAVSPLLGAAAALAGGLFGADGVVSGGHRLGFSGVVGG
mmetsp:Transcript_20947/g.50454  ORF Transcript_20947/g.50454 Transcript_20947/m.50454 type:complete len:547 (-) Transcript_20947:102-1742(-)